MDIDLRYPLAVAFFRAWLLDDQSAFGAATEFASVQSAGEAEALAEELQALHDSTPIPLESISLEVGLTFKSEESCRFWLDDVIRGLCGLERKRGAGFVPPASAIDRGSRLDSCPALGHFLSVDLLEAIEQSAVKRFQSRSSSEGVRQLVAEIRSVLEEEVLPIEEIETALGQYFASVNDARVWLRLLADCLLGKEVSWPDLTKPARTRPDPVVIELEAAFPTAWRFFASSYTEGQNDEQAVSSVLRSWPTGELVVLRQELLALASQEGIRIDKIEDVSDLYFEIQRDFRSWVVQIVRLLVV